MCVCAYHPCPYPDLMNITYITDLSRKRKSLLVCQWALEISIVLKPERQESFGQLNQCGFCCKHRMALQHINTLSTKEPTHSAQNRDVGHSGEFMSGQVPVNSNKVSKMIFGVINGPHSQLCQPMMQTCAQTTATSDILESSRPGKRQSTRTK